MAFIYQINDTTWRVEDRGVRMFLLQGTKRALLIDSGIMMPNAKEMVELLVDFPVELLNTHADPDHISGNRAFESLYMHPDEEENYRKHGGTGTILPVREGDVIDLGDRPLEIIEIPGHTPGSIAILDRNSRTLIVGDTVQDGNIYMFSERRNMAQYIETLKRLSTMKDRFDRLYPAHGSYCVEPDMIDTVLSYAEAVVNGEAEGEKIRLHGQEVLHYQFEKAGLLCDLK